MKVLVATEKPFAAVAVNGIKEVLDNAGVEMVLLEKYPDKAALLKAVEDVEGIYKLVKTLNFEMYRELTRNQYQVNGAEETQIEFLIQDPNGYLLRFTN